jgi:tetratricopeptide (TPR) repeat protein
MIGAESNRLAIAPIFLAAFTILILVASLNPQWNLWGLDFISVLPLWLRLTLITIIIILAVPQVSRKTGDSISKFLSKQTLRHLTYIYIFIVGLVFFLSFILQSESHILGDGFNVLGNIADSNISLGTEPLEYLFHRLLALFFSGPDAALNAYRFASHLAFLIFFISLYYLINDKIGLLIALTIVLCFSTMQFFFGYVENYTYAFILSFIFIWLAQNDYFRNAISIPTIIIFVLSISFHLRNIIFLPLLLLLAFNRFQRKKIFALVSGAILTLGIGLGIFALKSVVIDPASILLPLTASPSNNYTLLSGQHIRDMLNLLLLNFPLIILLPLIGKGIGKRYFVFWATAIIPALLFTFLIDPKIGAARDWDLLSVASAPIMLALITALISWKAANRKSLMAIIPALFIFAILHTGSWIFCNSNGAFSYARIKAIVDSDEHYSVNYYSGYRNKSWANAVNVEFKDIDEALRALKVRYQGDPNDTLNNGNLVTACLLAGDTVYAIQFIRDNWRRFVGNYGLTSQFGAAMVVAREYIDAEKILRTQLSSAEASYSLFYNYGVVMAHLGKTDLAIEYYNRAFKIWYDAPFDMEFKFCMHCIENKKYDIALETLRRINTKAPASYKDVIAGFTNLLNEKNYRMIDSIMAQDQSKAETKAIPLK